jgi:nucleotide-binding universal stress UspA family protein
MTVVVGYVPTPEGESALGHAIEEARRREERLVVVNTSRGDRLVDERFADDTQLETLRGRLREGGVDHEIRHGINGREASEEILTAAREHRAELVVIGLRRRSPVGKLLMGSTGQRVLLEAECPVLAVKGAPS